MANPTDIDYGEDNLIAGEINSDYKDALAGTYYRGQAMGKLEDDTYVNLDVTGTYAVLNETDIPVDSIILIDASFVGVSSGTALISADALMVNDATDQGLAEVARDAVAGAEKWTGVCAADITLASDGTIPMYISGAELQAASIVDGSGNALTITTALIENAQEQGLLIKEQ